jgi:hypothetical protein
MLHKSISSQLFELLASPQNSVAVSKEKEFRTDHTSTKRNFSWQKTGEKVENDNRSLEVYLSEIGLLT